MFAYRLTIVAGCIFILALLALYGDSQCKEKYGDRAKIRISRYNSNECAVEDGTFKSLY